MGREGIGGKSSSQRIPVGISDLMEAASSSGEEAEEVKGNWGEELSQNKEKKYVEEGILKSWIFF